jgi:predicted ATPase/Tfp pilus assembly protein PilF/DNA-binding XRE family transcriptional regulator
MQEEISFGTWLRKQRRALDLSRRALADQVGCAEITLRRIEAGTLKPSRELTNILLEKLGISESERPQWVSFARGLSGFPSQSISPPIEPISNLPAQLTTFIGREKEQVEVIRLLTKHRLVTLTGAGGVGKTRLSLKVSEQMLGNYADGLWLVEFAPILDPMFVPRAIAIAVGLRDEQQRPVIDMLSDYFREKDMLLILDNCEHLLDACTQLVGTLLKRCPRLKILGTSRESLGILGEAVYLVPSLELPDIGELIEKFRDYESVRLFEERAQLARMDFSLTIENASSIAKICIQLDGIPLAIELAAARTGTFSAEQIAARLQESFDLLTTGNRTALPRHQTLRAAIDWSYDLLSPDEKIVFQRLSVFVNGWTLEAAEFICSEVIITSEEILDLLAQLTNKSLVVTEEAQVGTRYHLLETIRQYAYQKLLESGGSEAIREKHLAYYVKLVEQAEPNLYRSNQVFWFKKLDDELDNFRLALEWALATNIESGLRITSVPWRFWQRSDYLQELGAWLHQLLERYPTDSSLRAHALTVYSTYMFVRGNVAEARNFAEQGLQLARVLLDRQNEAFSLLFLGRIIAFSGDYHKGIPLLEQSLALYRTLGDKIGEATATLWLSKNPNDLENSKTDLLESLKLHRELGNLSEIAWCLGILAQQAIFGEDFSSPLPWLEEARSIYRGIKDQSGEAEILTYLGTLAHWRNDYKEACVYFQQAIILYEKTDASRLSWPRVHLGHVFLQKGNLAQAKEALETSLQQFQKHDIVIGLIYAIEGLANLHLTQGQPERSLRLFAWADAMRERIGDSRPPVEQSSVERDLAIIRSHLDHIAFEKAYQTGRTMTTEQAIALGRES